MTTHAERTDATRPGPAGAGRGPVERPVAHRWSTTSARHGGALLLGPHRSAGWECAR